MYSLGPTFACLREDSLFIKVMLTALQLIFEQNVIGILALRLSSKVYTKLGTVLTRGLLIPNPIT